jgi:hypothetical protein
MGVKPQEILKYSALAFVGLLLAYPVYQVGLTRHFSAIEQGRLAAEVAPNDPLSQAAYAEQLLGFDRTTFQLSANAAAVVRSEVLAKRALTTDLLNARALRVLGLAAATRNDVKSLRAWSSAGWSRDKRDTMLTLLVMASSLAPSAQQGIDPELASDAIESLFRRRPNSLAEISNVFLSLIEQQPSLQSSIWKRMRTGKPWVTPFADILSAKASSSVVYSALSPEAALPKAIGERLRTRFGVRMLDENKLEEASVVLSPLITGSPSRLPVSIDRNLDGSVLGWTSFSAPRSTVAFLEERPDDSGPKGFGGSAIASYLGSGPAQDLFGRGVLLGPGRYQITFESKTTSKSGFFLQMKCWSGDVLAQSMIGDSPGGESKRQILEFAVPVANCPATRVIVGAVERNDLRPIDLQIWFSHITRMPDTGTLTPAVSDSSRSITP